MQNPGNPRARRRVARLAIGCGICAATQALAAAGDAVDSRDASVTMPSMFVTAARMPQPFTTDEVRLEIRFADRDPALYSTTIPYTMMWCR